MDEEHLAWYSCGNVLYDPAMYTGTRVKAILDEYQNITENFDGSWESMNKFVNLNYTLAGVGFALGGDIKEQDVKRFINIFGEFAQNGLYNTISITGVNSWEREMLGLFWEEAGHAVLNITFPFAGEGWSSSEIARIKGYNNAQYSNYIKAAQHAIQLTELDVVKQDPHIVGVNKLGAARILTSMFNPTLSNDQQSDLLNVIEQLMVFDSYGQNFDRQQRALPATNIILFDLIAAKGLSSDIDDTVTNIFNNNQQYGTVHSLLMRGANDTNIGVSCFAFDISDQLCQNSTTKALWLDARFGTTTNLHGVSFVHSGEDPARISYVADALQSTKAAFFKKTGALQPVVGDTNEQLTFVLFASNSEYEALANWLYDISSNSGGIYLEAQSTLYTFDRPDNSQLTIVELARHEYSHYLISRYIVPGLWGESLWNNERLTWFDEGLANYFAGASEFNGVSPLKSSVQGHVNDSGVHTIGEVTNATYGDYWMYPQAGLIWNFFDNQGSDTLVKLSQLLIDNNGAGFDAAVNQLANNSSLNTAFLTYKDSLDFDATDKTPFVDYLTVSELNDSGVNGVQTALTNVGFTDTSCTTIDGGLFFSCEFTISDVTGGLQTKLNTIEGVLDIAMQTVSGPNNLTTMNCYPIDIASNDATATCEGKLK